MVSLCYTLTAGTCKCFETYLEASTHPMHDIAYFLWGKRFFDVRSACMTFCLTKYDPSAFSRFTMIFVEPVRQVIVLQVIHVAHIIIYPMENRLPIEYLSMSSPTPGDQRSSRRGQVC